MSAHAPHVFTIAPGAPFLATLRDRLIDGTLIPGFGPDIDPLSLADVTIYLPTRRAARELRALFAAAHPSGSALLPSIRPLGELDEDEGYFEDTAASLELPPDIEPEQRVLELAILIERWGKAMGAGHVGDVPLALPASPGDAVWMARQLSSLMDDVARERGDWKKLESLVPEELAEWWQLTLKFMNIATTYWPARLAELERGEPQDRFNILMRHEAERLRTAGSRGPVIAAGSTGSVPATADLLAAIANLPNGAVVLPGLDRDMTKQALEELSATPPHPSVFGHPQFGLIRLLAKLGIQPGDVGVLDRIDDKCVARNKLVSLALLPADATHVWSNDKPHLANALCDVTEISAPNEVQEALAIAIALKEALELGHVPAALVTADRTLARRVGAELERFGIHADDSGGTPLAHTPPAALFQLMLDAAFDGSRLVETVMALLKHPLARLARKRGETRRVAELLELVWLRGHVVPLTLEGILDLLKSRPKLSRAERKHQPRWLARAGAKGIEEAIELGLSLETALDPLVRLAQSRQEVTVGECVQAAVAAFEAIGKDPETDLGTLYAGQAGMAFAEHLRSLAALTADFRFPASAFPSVHAALLSGKIVKPRAGSDPRIHIWGALEARLQPVEMVILGGLNEKSWPARPQDDPFLSRGMKAGIDLGPPERRTGLAAHDFQMLAGNKRLILTRAARQEGAPSVASRWLQRLHAAGGKDAVKAIQARGDRLLALALQLDARRNEPRATRPEPRPALSLRPKRLNVTEIETLIRDPYAIHAKKILGLEPLEKLLREPDAKERGNLFHKIAEEFVRSRKSAPGTIEELMAIGRKAFDAMALPAQIELPWWRRFVKMSEKFIAFETERHGSIFQSHVECEAAATQVGQTGVSLSGRADRIDVLVDGMAEIVDYKTGMQPSVTQARSLLAPQLPLEAALMAHGAFAQTGKREAAELMYVRLKSDGDVKAEKLSRKATKDKEMLTAGELADRAWQRLGETLIRYNDPQTPYVSRRVPFSTDLDGDYDHLARAAEWTSGDEGETGDDA